MGIRVECDWCRQAIEPGAPYVTIEVDGKIVKGHHAHPPRDVGGPARVYCGGDRYSDDDPANGGSTQAAGEWGHRRNCAERVLALLDGNPVGSADMGLEWKLVARGAGDPETLIDGPVDWLKLENRVIAALKSAGVTRIRELARLTEAQWLAIRGLGPTRGDEIRKALGAHGEVKPEKIVELEGLVPA